MNRLSKKRGQKVARRTDPVTTLSRYSQTITRGGKRRLKEKKGTGQRKNSITVGGLRAEEIKRMKR